MDILKTALLEMCRKNKKRFFYPEEILKIMYPEDWNQFIPELEKVVNELLKKGEIELNQENPQMPISELGSYSFKIKCNSKP
ncbi:hypothetical protein JYB64_06935 [Algoriphagus aestuarii]|nr:hypothetical protein [Algoriphagus aestuarii]